MLFVVSCLLAALPVGAASTHPMPSAAATIVTDAVAVPVGGHPVALASGTPLHLVVTLRSSDPAGLAALVASLGNPASPSYRHFLTVGQVSSRFAPSPTSVASVEGYFGAFGASGFSVTPDGFGVAFEIPSEGVSHALGVSMERVGAGPQLEPLYTAVGAATLPTSVSGLVGGIGGLSDVANLAFTTAVRPESARAPVRGPASFVLDGTSGLSEPWFFGSDFASAYRASSLFPPSTAVANATFPTGEAVATLLMSGYNQTYNTDLPPFDPAVVDAYYNDTFPSGWPHPVVQGQPVTVSGLTPPVPGYFNGINDTTENSVENCLDLEMAGSLAPGARLVNFYFSGSILAAPSSNPTNGDLADAFAETLSAALSYNYSPARLAVVSGSFGLPDVNDSLWNTELQVAQVLGVTVLAASGDQGNAPIDASGRFQGQWPTWPGTAAFDTTGTVAVGGLTPTLSGVPTSTFNGSELNASFDSSVTGVTSATAWYDTFGGYGNLSGSEGGASPVYGEPAWQFRSAAQPAIVNATVLEGLSSLGRSEPDLAFPANSTVAYILRNASGIYFQVLEGTSIAAPVFAGMLASAAAVDGHSFGYLDPELYRIGSYYAAAPTDPTNPYEDVTTGANYVFSAAPGWDAITGWGALDAVRFLAADANPAVSNYNYTGPTPGLPPFAPPVTYGTTSVWLLALVGIAVAVAVILVISLGRPKTPPPPAYSYAPGSYPPGGSGTTVPPGAAGPPPSWPQGYGPPAPGPGPLPPAAPHSFLCPYCGAPRPAEPTRCPFCGRL